MRLLARLRTSVSSVWLNPKPLPEPEPFASKPRPMTGFWSSLTEEQKKKALAYKGEEDHGDVNFAR